MAGFRYFTLKELIATNKGVDNTPTWEVVEHLAELTEKILEPLRAAYGKPITVSSGYRCEKLNKSVGGVSTSAHLIGYAVDLQAKDMEGFKKFVREWFLKTRPAFDQCIIERNDKTEWVHIGLYNQAGWQRGMLFQLNVYETR